MENREYLGTEFMYMAPTTEWILMNFVIIN